MDPGLKLRHVDHTKLSHEELKRLTCIPIQESGQGPTVDSHLYEARHSICSTATLAVPRLLYWYPLACCNTSCEVPESHMQFTTMSRRRYPNTPYWLHGFGLGKLLRHVLKHGWICLVRSNLLVYKKTTHGGRFFL